MSQLGKSSEAHPLQGRTSRRGSHRPCGNKTQTEGDPGSFLLGPHEPTVKMKVGGQPVTFMVDTGAEHSVVIFSVAPFSKRTATILGATWTQDTQQPFARLISVNWGATRSNTNLSDCPIPLLGRDILSKLRAQITFEPTRHTSLRLNPRQKETGL